MSEDEKHFKNLIRDMDIPSFRKEDYSWLIKNISIRNSDHRNFNEALNILKKICLDRNLIKKNKLEKILV